MSVIETLVEAKMCTFSLESTQFIFNKCPIYSYTHDGASAQCKCTSWDETDYWCALPSLSLWDSCTLWATLHPLSFPAPHWAAPPFYWAKTHPTEPHCTLLSYDAACWATLSHPTELCCTLLNYAVPSELAMLHLTEPRGTLLSYAAPYWATQYPLSCASPYWAKVHPASYTAPPYELAHPKWTTLHPTELLCSLLSYAAPCELHYSQTELPSLLVPLCNFAKCRNARLSGTGISAPQSGTGMLRYRTEMLDAGIPMPAASASMPMPSYGKYHGCSPCQL